ncbi:GrpB family protein [Modestobacter sp. VKM Ac-2977]|uniref:GrpB family protein n=1 Tax=Modestobacter sp. VKM Ac-2977 TaxID=3004131 RepID=UPI0022AB01BB|nr:GrpB family protein [Modestobacter sp. VKM Ac-2977]MCZ2821303.1 GrpB family protein [Modestobacter sp. VKM Ac-2977]
MDSSADRDAYLQSVLIGGREPVTIVVREYERGWPARFSVVRTRIRDALGARGLSIEHIGSTAVPELAAKPVVDVLVTVADVEDESAYAPALEAAGFPQRVREPGHRMFRTPERDVHIHVYQPDSPAVTDYLDLRDWLRQSAQDRNLYATTKRALAKQQWADMNDYADAKSDVIQAILTRARAWRSSGSR